MHHERNDGFCFKTKLRISVFINTLPAAKLLSWQQHLGCHFVSFVMHIDDAKFQEHCFNISRDIVYSVFPLFSCKPYDVITDLICIIEKCQYLYNEKRYFKKKNAILLYFERPFKYAQKIFHFIGTLRITVCTRQTSWLYSEEVITS